MTGLFIVSRATVWEVWMWRRNWGFTWDDHSLLVPVAPLVAVRAHTIVQRLCYGESVLGARVKILPVLCRIHAAMSAMKLLLIVLRRIVFLHGGSKA